MPELRHIGAVFRIHLARLRAEAGPFLLAALVFPTAMYLFANGARMRERAEAALILSFAGRHTL